MGFLKQFFNQSERGRKKQQRLAAFEQYQRLTEHTLALTGSGRLTLEDDFNLRFEVATLFLARVLHFWSEEGNREEEMQALWDMAFEGFDHALRQRGVNDIRMAARMTKLFRYATGRRDAYVAAWSSKVPSELRVAIARNVLNGVPPEDPQVDVVLTSLEQIQADAF